MEGEQKKETRFLNMISPEAGEYLLKSGTMIQRKRGERIFEEKEEGSPLYFLLEGYASLYRSSRYGEDRILMVCATGDLLNESSIEGTRTPAAAEALSDVKLLSVDRETFAAMLEGNFALMQAVCRSLSVKASRLYHQLGNANGTYPLEKRLAARLLRLSKEYGSDTREGRRIGFKVTVSFLANLLGAKRESVSRYMSGLKKKGYIRHEEGMLTVTDPEGLRAFLDME